MTVVLINPDNGRELREDSGNLTDGEVTVFPKKEGVFRTLDSPDYTGSFGFQWNKFEKTQVDKYRRDGKQSQERFKKVTGWGQENTYGQDLLEVGCGAGRFTHAALELTQARIYSVDSSQAVEANFRNNGGSDRLHLFQASIYKLPFKVASFDRAFCFGVLQHTPDPGKTVSCLASMLKVKGELIVDFYPLKGWHTKIHIKYLLRPWTKKLKPERLLELIENNINWLIRINKLLDRIGLNGLNRFVPICDLKTTLPSGLSPTETREWAVLDTFDMFSPTYDKPERIKTVKKWFEESGLTVTFAGFVGYGSNNSVAVVKGIRNN